MPATMLEKGRSGLRHRRRVLVVDDDPDLRWFLSDLLAAEGFEVVTAQEGMEALTKVRTRHPDIVLLDLRMPGIDGVQTLDRLHQDRCHVPIILVTGHDDMLSPAEAIRRGACAFLRKPFRTADLLTSITQALRKADLARAGEERPGFEEGELTFEQLPVGEHFDWLSGPEL